MAVRRICCGYLLLLIGAALPLPAAAQDKTAQPPASSAGSAAIQKFTIVSQEWHRFTGLVAADITFRNANDYAVHNPVISCEFLDPKGGPALTRGSTVFQSFPPGTREVQGIEFPLREKNARPGSCHVISVSPSLPAE